MEIIRQSRGVAKDYAPLLLDLYENKNGKVKPINNALEKLTKDAVSLNSQKDQQEILVGYKSDPYPDDEIELNQTEGAIKTLIENNLSFSILTEKAENALQHFEILKGHNKARYGLKLLPNSNGQRLTIGEPPLLFGIESLKEANKRGIKTWVDLDPTFKPDITRKIVWELYQVVDQWKLNGTKFDIKPESKSDWKQFEKDADGLLDSLGIGSPWTESVIPTRKGNRNILVIAPHGHPKDDTGTYRLARQLSDELDCYAVINEKYRKPENVKSDEKYEKKYLADLNLWPEIENSKEAMKDFIDPIKEIKDQILQRFDSLFILHIHGIGNDNRKRVAKLLPKFKDNPEDLHLLIGYGQHRTDNDRKTADLNNYVGPLCDLFRKQGLNAANAPTGAIKDKNGEDQWYCGNHSDRLNQRLCKPKNKIQSLQLEFKKSGIRKNETQAFNTAKLLGEALSELISETWNDIAGKSQADAETNNQTLPAEAQPLLESENGKVKIGNTQIVGDRPCQVETRKIADLRPHPLNREIYGDPNSDDGLKISIQKNGILTPLIVSGDGTIVSGHRRFSGAKECGIEQVPVIIMPPCDDLDIEETLIVANTQRQKTKEQIAREYEKLKIIEGEKSKIRMSLAGGDRKSEEYKKSHAQNSAAPISKGDSRENAAARLGISHDTAEKALKVINLADELKAEGKTEQTKKLLDTLNSKSVNSAIKYVKAISEDPDILTQNTKPVFNKTNESIEWATWTWNPITGCKAGCEYCYGPSMTKRFPDKFPKGFEPTFYPKRLEAPANTSVPKSNHIGDRNVFVVSMGDLFGDWVEQEWIDAVLDAVRIYPQWNYLFLTKNPKRLVDIEWPDNAWVGTTVDCQARVKPAEEAFEKIKAKVKFLSCEPLSEEIAFTNLTLFDWVIVGARSKTTEVTEKQPESEWVKSLMLQAWDAGCKVYCKPNLKAGVKEYPLAESVA